MRLQHLEPLFFLIFSHTLCLFRHVKLHAVGLLSLLANDRSKLSIGQEKVGLHVVLKAGVENALKTTSKLRLQDRNHQLHPLVQIARHPVSTGNENLRITTMVEGEDAGVFEIAIDDANHANTLAVRARTWLQAADATDVKLDVHASVSGSIESVDDLHILQAVHLGRDFGWLALSSAFRLTFDQFDQTVFHQGW